MVSQFCEQCDASVEPDANFCQQCGASLKVQAPVEQTASDQALQPQLQAVNREARQSKRQGAPPLEAIAWEQEVSLLTDILTLKDVFIVLAIGLLSLQVVLLIGSTILDGRPVFLPARVYLILIGIFVGLSLLAVLILRRYTLHYTIHDKGISYAQGARERRLNRLLALLAILSGKPQAMGLAAATTSAETGTISWRQVYKVTVHRGLCVITVSDAWHPLLRLYCPAQRFEEIAARVEAYAAEAAAWRASRNVSRSRTGFILKWTLLVILAMMAALVWFRQRTGFSDLWGAEFHWASNDVPSLVLVISAVVLLAGVLEGWLRRGAALLATLGSAYLAYRLILLGMTTFPSAQGVPLHGYQAEPLGFVLSLVGGLVLLVMSSVRLVGYSR